MFLVVLIHSLCWESEQVQLSVIHIQTALQLSHSEHNISSTFLGTKLNSILSLLILFPINSYNLVSVNLITWFNIHCYDDDAISIIRHGTFLYPLIDRWLSLCPVLSDTLSQELFSCLYYLHLNCFIYHTVVNLIGWSLCWVKLPSSLKHFTLLILRSLSPSLLVQSILYIFLILLHCPLSSIISNFFLSFYDLGVDHLLDEKNVDRQQHTYKIIGWPSLFWEEIVD